MASQRRLLIVDDDPEILVQLRWALQDDFELLLASDPRQAAELAHRGRAPAAALVDLHLPPDVGSIEGGLALIRDLRQTCAGTRIIAFTAQYDDEAERRSRSAGAEQLLMKPVERSVLLRLLRR